ALEVLQRAELPAGGGEAEGGSGESQRQDLLRRGAGDGEHVLAGDAGGDEPGGAAGRDGARAQRVLLDLALVVDDHELLGHAEAAVARLLQQLGSGIGQGALVGDGDAEHVSSFARGGRRARWTGEGDGRSSAERATAEGSQMSVDVLEGEAL